MPSSLNRLLPGIRHPARSGLIPITKAILSRNQKDLGQNYIGAKIPNLKPSEEIHSARTDLIQPTGRPNFSLRILEKVPTVFPDHHGSKFERVPYWQNIPRWKNVTENQFLSYEWNVSGPQFHHTPILKIIRRRK
jgi:hypothetical protein